MVFSLVEFTIKFCRGGNTFLSPILLFDVSNNEIDIRQINMREINLFHMYEREPHKNMRPEVVRPALAQLAEHLPRYRKLAGSVPSQGTCSARGLVTGWVHLRGN